jgi:hypothetical protein
MIKSENNFAFIRPYLLNKPTIPEYWIAKRIAKTIDVNSKEKVDNPLVKAQLHNPLRTDFFSIEK